MHVVQDNAQDKALGKDGIGKRQYYEKAAIGKGGVVKMHSQEKAAL